MLGEDFRDRMKYRLANAVEYRLMVAIRAFTEADAYSDSTTMHWGTYSKDYPTVTFGEYFPIYESVTPYLRWKADMN